MREYKPAEYSPPFEGDVEKQMSMLQEVVKAIRHLRSELKLPPNQKSAPIIVVSDPHKRLLIRQNLGWMCHLSNSSSIEIREGN